MKRIPVEREPRPNGRAVPPDEGGRKSGAPAASSGVLPHGYSWLCRACRHACALAVVDPVTTAIQCGNTDHPLCGSWTDDWIPGASERTDASRCERFERTEELVSHPGRGGLGRFSPGFADAWRESLERLRTFYRWTRTGRDESRRPMPADVAAPGLPPEEILSRSYVRIRNAAAGTRLPLAGAPR